MRRIAILGILFAAALISSCDEDPIAPPTTGSITLEVIVGPVPAVPVAADSSPGGGVAQPPDVVVVSNTDGTLGVTIADSTGPGRLSIGTPDPEKRRSLVIRNVEEDATAEERQKPTATSAASEAAMAIEEATVRVIGPNTNIVMENQAPGSSVTIDNLAPATYTVVLEGYEDGGVD